MNVTRFYTEIDRQWEEFRKTLRGAIETCERIEGSLDSAERLIRMMQHSIKKKSSIEKEFRLLDVKVLRVQETK